MANPKLKPNQFLLPCGAMITERPILFSTDMVKANLEDRKTQTRRTRGLDTANENPDLWEKKGNDTIVHKEHGFIIDAANSHYGKPGDLLWVKETWVRRVDFFRDEWVDYKATGNGEVEWDEIDEDPWGNKVNVRKSPKWKPSIHMPKVASRIWVMVEEIRVEQLQDISEENAIAEGVEYAHKDDFRFFKDYTGRKYHLATARESFKTLWISINSEASWDANPWVWVVKYRILSKIGRPLIETIEINYLEITGKEVSNV